MDGTLCRLRPMRRTARRIRPPCVRNSAGRLRVSRSVFKSRRMPESGNGRSRDGTGRSDVSPPASFPSEKASSSRMKCPPRPAAKARRDATCALPCAASTLSEHSAIYDCHPGLQQQVGHQTIKGCPNFFRAAQNAITTAWHQLSDHIAKHGTLNSCGAFRAPCRQKVGGSA